MLKWTSCLRDIDTHFALQYWSLSQFERHWCHYIGSCSCKWHVTVLISTELFASSFWHLSVRLICSDSLPDTEVRFAEGSVRVTLRFIQSSWVSKMKKKKDSKLQPKWNRGSSSASKLWTQFNQLRWFKRYQRRSQGLLVCDTACETQAKTEADWDFIATRNISLIGS